MAEDKWIALSQTNCDKLEKALNLRLGGKFLPHKQVTMSDTNIASVVVDTDRMLRLADANNLPLNKWWVNITTLKFFINKKGPVIINKINQRFGIDVKQYISNNAVLQSEMVIYQPTD